MLRKLLLVVVIVVFSVISQAVPVQQTYIFSAGRTTGFDQSTFYYYAQKYGVQITSIEKDGHFTYVTYYVHFSGEPENCVNFQNGLHQLTQ